MKQTCTTPKFSHGFTIVTPAALDAICFSGETTASFLSRHIQGDWGDVSEEDRLHNEQALLHGGRLLSSYNLLNGECLLIITDASGTWVFLSEEY
jgi:hypothetical protein